MSIGELETIVSQMELELQVNVIFPVKPQKIMLEYRRLCAELMTPGELSPDYLMSDEFSRELASELGSDELSGVTWTKSDLDGKEPDA